MPEVKKGWCDKIKDHPIWSAVVAALIAAVVISFFTWILPGGWNTLGTWVSATWH